MSAKRWMYRNPESNDVEILTELEINNLKRAGQPIAAKVFLNFVTILGSARQGKSTLMNHIIGTDVFKTSDDTDGCTQGVECFSELETSDNGVLVYVDTEGQGSDVMENDVKLFAPVVFLSKVIIFNVMGAITPLELLQKLKVFLQIRERLNLEHNGPFKLGHLIVVLRDYKLKGTEKDAYIRFFLQEDSNGEFVQEKNEIRGKLLSLFESCEVVFFHKPLTEMKMNDDFSREQADVLKIQIRNKVREPRKFGGSTYLTPDNVSTFTQKLVEQVNKPLYDFFRMKMVVGLVQIEELDLAFKHCKICFLKLLHRHGLFGDSDENTLTTKKDELMKQFDENSNKANFVNKSILKNKKRKLESFFKERLDVVKQDKESLCKATEKAIIQIGNELEQTFRRISLREKIQNELDREIESARQKVRQIDTMQYIDDCHKKQLLGEFKEFSVWKRKEKIEENNERLREREIIDKAKTAFEESMQKKNANQDDGIVERLQKIIETELFEKFKRSISGVKLEVDYKNNVISAELINHKGEYRTPSVFQKYAGMVRDMEFYRGENNPFTVMKIL